MRRPVIWVPVAALVLIIVVISFFRGADDRDAVPFSEVLTLARDGRVERIEARGGRLEVTLRGQEDDIVSRMGSGNDLIAALADAGVDVGTGGNSVEVEYKGATQGSQWYGVLFYCSFLAVLLVGIYFVVRNAVREGMRRNRAEPTNGSTDA